jgi:hypothetical protein
MVEGEDPAANSAQERLLCNSECMSRSKTRSIRPYCSILCWVTHSTPVNINIAWQPRVWGLLQVEDRMIRYCSGIPPSASTLRYVPIDRLLGSSVSRPIMVSGDGVPEICLPGGRRGTETESARGMEGIEAVATPL